MKHLTIIAMMITLATLSYADYHYASHEGSNEYPYTSWETAADSIQNAVDAASPHDTVYIGSGDWFESVITQQYDTLAIIGMGTDSTFMYTDEYHVAVLTVYDDHIVEGITFQHLDLWHCIDIPIWVGYGIIKNCRFEDSGFAIVGDGGKVIIENCVFDSCVKAIDCPLYVDTVIIRNNLVLHCYAINNAIVVQGTGSGLIEKNIVINSRTFNTNGIICGGTSIIRNNMVINGQDGIAHSGLDYNNTISNAYEIGVRSNNAGIIIYNNSISYCHHGIGILGGGGTINYNNFWGNNIDIYYEPDDSIGNIFCDPMFVDHDGHDYHLQAYSPLIDAGDPNVLDVDGTRSDIGCYGGPHGCSYTYLDLAPKIPDSIEVEAESLTVTLIWPYNTEADFNRYQIFRDTTSGFEPTIFDMIAEPETSYYEDTDIEGGTAYYYRLTSVDNQGNVSDYSEEVAVIPTSIPSFFDDGLPQYTVIERAYPNPSNSNVTIVYSASNLGPQPPEIKLQIFDIQGRVVKTLVNDRIPMGTYRAVWDGTNDNGEAVASGTYIARVFQWGQSAGDFPVKITLIK